MNDTCEGWCSCCQVGDDGDIVDVKTSENGTVSVEVGDMGSIVDVEKSENGTVEVKVIGTGDEDVPEPSADPDTPLKDEAGGL